MSEQQVPPSDFEQQYTRLREKEQRIYTTEQIALLPNIDPGHVHYQEWLLRKRSCDRLLRYLTRQKRPLHILESGCGNGWLSARLAAIPQSTVTGIDVNHTELQQAKAVFGNTANLSFRYGDLRDATFDDQRYDILVFAASVQYFSSLKDILTRALSLLRPGGEVHLVDTHFYTEQEALAAQERSRQYFESLGFPAMDAYYFHHRFSDLKGFRYRVLFNPASLIQKLSGNKARFPWIRLSNDH